MVKIKKKKVRNNSKKIKRIVRKKERKIGKKVFKRNNRERVSIGILNLDKFCEGGFVKNSTNLLTGGSGYGKSIFSMQFLIKGIQKKEKCLYITFEEKKTEFYRNMERFGWDLDNLEKKGFFFFLEYTPEKVKTMLEEGGGIIESIILKEKIERVVIDSITSFELLFDDDTKKRTASLALFNMLRRWNCTTLLTYERDPVSDRRASSKTLGFQSDSIIDIYSIREKKERKRYLEIIKMRGTNHSTKIYPLFMTKKGIEVKNRPYIGNVKTD